MLISCFELYSQEIDKDYNFQASPFNELKKFPIISDTTVFIQKLKENCHLYTLGEKKRVEKINYFKKIKIYGGNNFIYLLEYDYKTGTNASFPWKMQILFDSNCKLLKILFDVRLHIVKIFPKALPFIFALSSTSKGNGAHEVYRLKDGKLEQVYDGFLGNRPQTYSTGYSFYVTDPFELYHKFIDVNKDGWNDIVFFGKVRYSEQDLGIGNKEKIISVKYIFLYNTKTEHFSELEDYSKKYEYIYGNTK